jgi:hypothetical protein
MFFTYIANFWGKPIDDKMNILPFIFNNCYGKSKS